MMKLYSRLRIHTKLVVTMIASMVLAMLLISAAAGTLILLLLRQAQPGDYNPFAAAGQLLSRTPAVARALEEGAATDELRKAAVPEWLPASVRVQLIREDGLVLIDTQGGEGRIISGPEMVFTLSRMGDKRSRLISIPQAVNVNGKAWGLYIMSFHSAISANITLGDGSPESQATAFSMIGGLAAALLANVLLYLFLGRHLVAPIRRLSAVVGQIARGDLSVRSNLGDRGDEVGQLASDVDAMAASLQTAREQAAAADKSRRYMVAAASHDLRTPLTALLAHAEAVRTGISEDSDRSLAIIQEKGLQLKRLIDDLFELASLDAEQERWQTVRVDLAELVRREVVGILPELESAGIEVEADIPEEPVWTNLAPGKVDRVLDNLLANARNYGAAGKWLGVRVSVRGRTVRVEVADRGPGIPAEEREKVFERFYRSDAARTSNHGSGGRGLGLAIARELIVRHGGTIGVDSAPEGGARFWFELPLAMN